MLYVKGYCDTRLLPKYCTYFNIALPTPYQAELSEYRDSPVVVQDSSSADCFFISDRIRTNMTYLILSDMTELRHILPSKPEDSSPLSLQEVKNCLDAMMERESGTRTEYLSSICKFLRNASSQYLKHVSLSLVIQDLLRTHCNVVLVKTNLDLAGESFSSRKDMESKLGLFEKKYKKGNARCGI